MFIKAVIVGLFAGLSGLIFYLTPLGSSLEQHAGLDFFFKLRGVRPVPAEVVVVSIDKISAERLGLPDNPEKWPRSIHAQLIENLSEAGAAVIAFDLFFNEEREPAEDNALATAMTKTGNVVLCKYLMKDVAIDKSGNVIGNLHIVKCVPPIPILAKAAHAVACFPLPKVPFKVMQYWAFSQAAGGMPTLPVVMSQSYFLKMADEELGRVLARASPDQTGKLAQGKKTGSNSQEIRDVVRAMRTVFAKDPALAPKMLADLDNLADPRLAPEKKQLVASLIKMYQGPDSRYLNFYGPPRTIRTVPYYQVLQQNKVPSVSRNPLDFKNKAVFVGVSENIESEKKNDGYITTFSKSGGIGISGVEIAATAFANLLEDNAISPLRFQASLAIILLWGIVVGTLCRFFVTDKAVVSVTGIAVLYGGVAYYQFAQQSAWYPVIIPLFFQVPVAGIATLIWNYVESNRERQHIKRAFTYYLPNEVVEQLSVDAGHIKADSKLVYGTCLCTDAKDYTSISEIMEPAELSSFMNRYYEIIFEPIKNHGGVVSNVIGDSMLSLWVTMNADQASYGEAAAAALDIVNAVNRYRPPANIKLFTRIGVHTGHIVLGNIGAFDHYEYRPVGDIVNTTSRIEGLNKFLGTRILVSEEMHEHLEGFLTRRIGKFLLVGKSKPIVVYELMGRLAESDLRQERRCTFFSEAYGAFRNQAWGEAIQGFNELIATFGDDGPSLFYRRLCQQYKTRHFEDVWDGMISMVNK